MRKPLWALVGVAALGCALVAGASWKMPAVAASADILDKAACLARSAGPPKVALGAGAGADRYDLAWMGEREHFAVVPGRVPYIVRIADTESPRSLIAHDRLVLPGSPGDWIAAPRAADLVLCARHVPAVVTIARQFCAAPVSAGDIANGEIEEITFLGGTSWLADVLHRQIEADMPAELAEDLRHEVAMASPARHARDLDAPRVVAYADEVERLVAAWQIVPMSQALGDHGSSAEVAAGCAARHADLRRGIVPARRVK